MSRGRAPHLWLGDESLYDRFGFEWTLLRLGRSPVPGGAFVEEARRRGVSLTVVDVDDDRAQALYGDRLALVRPDQIVAWRGDVEARADAVWNRVLSARAS
jgi:hypothetical protein